MKKCLTFTEWFDILIKLSREYEAQQNLENFTVCKFSQNYKQPILVKELERVHDNFLKKTNTIILIKNIAKRKSV